MMFRLHGDRPTCCTASASTCSISTVSTSTPSANARTASGSLKLPTTCPRSVDRRQQADISEVSAIPTDQLGAAPLRAACIHDDQEAATHNARFGRALLPKPGMRLA